MKPHADQFGLLTKFQQDVPRTTNGDQEQNSWRRPLRAHRMRGRLLTTQIDRDGADLRFGDSDLCCQSMPEQTKADLGRGEPDSERQKPLDLVPREDLERLRSVYEAQIAGLRKGIRYEIGDIIVQAVTNPKSLRRLPRRLRYLWGQARRSRRRAHTRHRTATLAPMSDLPPRRNVPVAVILDEFSWQCFAPEARFVNLDPSNWQSQITTVRPELILVESAWRGNANKWKYAVNKFDSREPNHLAELLRWAASTNVPAVFWNKEDPVNFEEFIAAARHFPFILTTAQEAVGWYRSDAPDAQVDVLPFAAQPRIHNPIGSRSAVRNRIAFAGAWRGDKYEHRQNEFEILLDPAMELGLLDIYDRYADDPNAAALGFPTKYRRAVRGSLSYDRMVEEYRRYAGFLNVNSVQHSRTMFSRRVFEILACGTPVVSSRSPGIEELLGEHVVMVDSPAATRSIVEELVYDVDARQRRGHLGYRHVHQHHSYRDRFDDILRVAGLDHVTSSSPHVTVVAVSNRPAQLHHIIDSFARQSYAEKDLIFVANSNGFDRETVASALEPYAAQALFIDESATLAECLNEAVAIAGGRYIAKFDDDDDYGEHYLSDTMLTFEYSGAAVAGKQSYYAYLHSSDQSVLRFPGNEFQVTNQVAGGTLVFDRHATAGISFTPVQRGTDSLFLKSCEAAGLTIFSSDRFNFVQHRHADVTQHTWRIDEDEFLAKCERLGTGYRSEVMFL